MEQILIFPAGTGRACAHATAHLKQHGIAVTDQPSSDVTHLLLDVPTKEVPISLLDQLSKHVTVIGGNLLLQNQNTIDLLQNEAYLVRNAAITAECAVQVAMEHIGYVLHGCEVLIIGWGRIGKYLASLLKKIGCRVSVAVRNPKDKAILEVFGYHTMDVGEIDGHYDIVFNTVPAKIGPVDGRIQIELSSEVGLSGENVILARGLPGRYAPESSGRLIAETILKEVRK